MSDVLDAPTRQAGLNYVGGAWVPSASGRDVHAHEPDAPVGARRRVLRVRGGRRRCRGRSRGRGVRGLGRRRRSRVRGRYLNAAAAALESRAEEIARDMSTEMGKPLREARGETARASQILRYAASEAFRPVGEHFEQSLDRRTGVDAPAPGRCRRADHAVELPDRDPDLEARTGARLREHRRAEARLRGAAHRPAHRRGVRRGRAARRRAEHPHGPRLDGRRGARRATRACGRSRSPGRSRPATPCATKRRRPGKRVQLELGGHNPMIVMADADLDRAVEAAYAGAFWSAGQKCTATRRIYVQDAVYDAFRDGAARADRARARRRPARPRRRGRPDRQRRRSSTRSSRRSSAASARAAPCSRAASAPTRDGFLIPPTVFEGVADDAFLSCEEVFGPVTSLYRFDEPRRGARARERGRVRPVDGDLHVESRDRDAVPERGAGGADPRQLADRGRRGARPVRRHQVERLRPARAGPRGDRVLHRDRSRSTSTPETPGPAGCEPRRAEREVDDDQRRAEADDRPEHGVEAAVRSRIAPSSSGESAESV